jgi:hypothetical protein
MPMFLDDVIIFGVYLSENDIALLCPPKPAMFLDEMIISSDALTAGDVLLLSNATQDT